MLKITDLIKLTKKELTQLKANHTAPDTITGPKAVVRIFHPSTDFEILLFSYNEDFDIFECIVDATPGGMYREHGSIDVAQIQQWNDVHKKQVFCQLEKESSFYKATTMDKHLNTNTREL